MVDVSDFISLEEHHERQLAEFMQWEYILEQQKGSAYDFVAKDTSKIEANLTGTPSKPVTTTSNLPKPMTTKRPCAIGLCPLGRRSGLLGRD